MLRFIEIETSACVPPRKLNSKIVLFCVFFQQLLSPFYTNFLNVSFDILNYQLQLMHALYISGFWIGIRFDGRSSLNNLLLKCQSYQFVKIIIKDYQKKFRKFFLKFLMLCLLHSNNWSFSLFISITEFYFKKSSQIIYHKWISYRCELSDVPLNYVLWDCLCTDVEWDCC